MTIDDNDRKEGDGALPILIKTRSDEPLRTDGDTRQPALADIVSELKGDDGLLIKSLDRFVIGNSLPPSCRQSPQRPNPDVSRRKDLLSRVLMLQRFFHRESAIEVAQARITVLKSGIDRMGLWGKFLYYLDFSLPSIIVDGVSMLRYDAGRELVSLDDQISRYPDQLSCTASEYRRQLVEAVRVVFSMIETDTSLRAVLTADDIKMLQGILDSSTTCDEL